MIISRRTLKCSFVVLSIFLSQLCSAQAAKVGEFNDITILNLGYTFYTGMWWEITVESLSQEGVVKDPEGNFLQIGDILTGSYPVYSADPFAGPNIEFGVRVALKGVPTIAGELYPCDPQVVITAAICFNGMFTDDSLFGPIYCATIDDDEPFEVILFGDENACLPTFLSQQPTYGIPLIEGATVNWEVSNGNVTLGQTTSNIRVQFDSPGLHTVSVEQCFEGNCYEASMEVMVNDIASTDLNGDDEISVEDFTLFNSSYGLSCTCPADIDGNGMVNVLDFLLLNSSFGQSCE